MDNGSNLDDNNLEQDTDTPSNDDDAALDDAEDNTDTMSDTVQQTGESGGDAENNTGTTDESTDETTPDDNGNSSTPTDSSEDSTETDGSEQEQHTESESEADSETPEVPEEQTDTIPAIDPSSSAGQLISRLDLLTGRTLLRLNQALNQGEVLTDNQQQCIGSFDPAIGEVLLAVECEIPLATGSVPIYAASASFVNTATCQDSISAGNSSGCELAEANFDVPTIWTIPVTGPGQPERPQPEAGAIVKYSIDTNRMSIENRPFAVSGNFHCEIDLSSAELTQTQTFSNCNNEFMRIVELIDLHLEN